MLVRSIPDVRLLGVLVLLLAGAAPGLAQCSFTLNPASATIGAGGGTGTVGVTASASNCPRTATSHAEWITITFGASGTGDGIVGYAVPANPTLNPRTGTITIGGQTFTLTQNGGACSFSISPSSATISPNGATPSFNVVATAGCQWTATSSAPWVTVTTPSGTGAGAVSYQVAPNPNPTVRTATITVGSQTFTVVQSAACSLALAPGGVTVPAAGGTGTVTVTANATSCDRSVTSEVSWISISFGANGTGSGQFGYTVAPNTTGQARTGSLRVGPQAVFTVYQEAGACTIVLAPALAMVEAKGGTGTVNVTATPGCNWTATTAADWITITFGASGTGDGVVGYAVPANNLLTTRTGTITIGSQSVTINQQGTACSYSLSPSSASIAPAGGAGSFNVNATAGCAWNALSNADWLVITSGGGSGPGTVSYLAAPNTGGSPRTASVTVATQTFTATQAGTCTLVLNPPAVAVPASGGSGTVSVTASSSSCDRSVSSPVTWITITSGASGTGSGQFGYTVTANTTGQFRSATLTVGGQAFNVSQEATTCTLVITPTAPTWPAAGGTGSLTVTTSCTWTATSNSDWIAVLSGSGTGNGTIRYAVAANTSTESRLGSLSIGGQSFNIHQNGVPCTVTLGTARASFPVTGGAGSIEVLTGAECSWTAVSGAAWIVLESGATGTGPGTVIYTVAPNTQPQARTAAIAVANQLFTVSQPAAACELALSSATATVPSAGGTGSFTVISNCNWTASTSARWVTLSGASGSGEGAVSFTVAANSSADGRTATITVGSLSFTIVQGGVSCNVTLAPASADVAGSGGTGTLSVASGTGCKWTPASQAEWIKITAWSNVSGTGQVQYAVLPNPTRYARTGTLVVSGQTFSVIQGPAEIVLTAQRVVNAASFLGGPVAPGEIVSLFGVFTGPASPATIELSADGKFVTTSLAGTRLFFDELAAPLLYVSDTQVSAIVPYGVAGKAEARVKLEHQGLASTPVTLKVAPAAPGLFTVDSSGKGQGAILNQDYSLNGPSNAAARNSVVMLFATGAGQTQPGGVDGQLAAAPLPTPRLPVSVRIGGASASVLYAGAAPGLVSGVLQVNVRVPQQVAVGNAVPVVLRVGESDSQSQVTMAVK